MWLPKQMREASVQSKVRPDWACETVEPYSCSRKPVCEAVFIQDLFSVLCYLSDPFLRFDALQSGILREERFCCPVQPVERFLCAVL